MEAEVYKDGYLSTRKVCSCLSNVGDNKTNSIVT